MKPQTSAIKPIMIVICVIVVAYFTLRVVLSIGTNSIDIESVYPYTSEDVTTVSGYIVRDEQVLPSSSAILDITRSEGERVGKGQAVAVAYSSQDALDRKSQLETLQMELSQLQFAQSETLSASAAIKLDGNIVSDMLTLQSNVASRKLSSLETDVAELKSLVLKRDFTYSDSVDLSAQIVSVSAQIASLKASSAYDTKNITVDESGIYSAVVDGYENVLTPDIIPTLTPSALAAVTADSSVSSSVGKLIIGNTWYFAANMDEATALTYKVGNKVSLHFAKDFDIAIVTTVLRISDTEDGQKTVVFTCDKYLPEITLLRHQKADIIRASYSGLRVPTEALRVENGVSGVYCLVGLQARFKPVDVVFRGEGYYLVEASKNSDNTTNNGISSLRNGDQVIITAQELYDGKVIES
ncbi:MAG: HlyD family efflux transporter periplasmic adaptor subunit [Oscillospiraceae bacterium]|nr:HlyD family efflux transporter periplasmic adaptor subunit [Oscillospiraceae bacterium]